MRCDNLIVQSGLSVAFRGNRAHRLIVQPKLSVTFSGNSATRQLHSSKTLTSISTTPSKESMELEKFLRDLGVRDPCEDKERLRPGGSKPNKAAWLRLLAGLDPEGKPGGFRSEVDTWRKREPSQVLCIQGERGTGKTTMMIAMTEYLVDLPEPTPSNIVQQLRGRTKPKPALLSYFFFQRNDDGRNNVVAALKGLVYQLINQSKDLVPKVDLLRHVAKYGDAGSCIFKGPTAVFLLRNILHDILQDEAISKVYLLVDALDECSVGLPQLLETISDQSYKANWLVTTSQPDIVKELGTSVMIFDTKQNASNVSVLIDSNIQELVFRKRLDSKYEDATKKYLVKKSDSSFLWVDLACKELDLGLLKADDDDFRDLQSGLEPLYDKVDRKILTKGDEDQKLLEFLDDILGWVLFSYRPLHLKELQTLMDSGKSQQELSDSLTLWAPLLTIHQDTIYFVHQSARDYLSSSHHSTTDYHWNIMSKCLELMKRGLGKDILDPTAVDTKNKANIKQDETKDPLTQIEYACSYWVDHLSEFLKNQEKKDDHFSDLSDDGNIHQFLKFYILHWLVALCMMRKGTDSICMLTILDSKLVSIPTRLFL